MWLRIHLLNCHLFAFPYAENLMWLLKENVGTHFWGFFVLGRGEFFGFRLVTFGLQLALNVGSGLPINFMASGIMNWCTS